MSTLIVLPIKRKQDVQRYGFDFLNIIGSDDSITSASVTARVFTGEDATPNNILLGAVEIEGTVVYQTVQEGVVGVIYELSVVASTTLGFDYLIKARLAIPPTSPAGAGGDLTIEGNLLGAFVGDLASGAYTSTGGVLPKTYAVTNLFLPPGLTLAADGTWSGQHHGGSNADPFWDYTWDVTVTDAYGNTATLTDGCRVTNFTISGDVPNGDIGELIAGTYTNSHGVLPISYAIDTGTFPFDLTLNTDGTYDGTYPDPGYWEWNIIATDAVGNIATLYDDAEVLGPMTFYAAIDLRDYIVRSIDSGASFPDQIVSGVIDHSEILIDYANSRLFHWSENSCMRSDDSGALWNAVLGLPASAPSAVLWTGAEYLAFAQTSVYSGDGSVFSLRHSGSCRRPVMRGATILGIMGGRWFTISIDTGGTFSNYQDVSYNTFEGIQCIANNGTYYVTAGNDGAAQLVIRRSLTGVDGSWTTLTAPATAIAHGLVFAESGILYMVLKTGEFFYSFDQGTSWFTGPSVPYGGAASYPTSQRNKLQTGISATGDDVVLFGSELGGGLNRIYRWGFGDVSWTAAFTTPSGLRCDSIARKSSNP